MKGVPISITPRLADKPKVGDTVQTEIGQGIIERFEKGVAIIVVTEGGCRIDQRTDVRSLRLNR